MQCTVVQFPGGKKKVELPGPSATLEQVLNQAEVIYDAGEKADLAVNGETTTNLQAQVPDGSTVTKTRRIEGA